jgi:hypothetical protein
LSDGLTYNDALTILGRPKNRLASLLDAAATAGLSGWAAAAFATTGDMSAALSLLELKNDLVGFAQKISVQVSDWRRGLTRFDRSQRLVAAHAIIAISSYFEALDQASFPVSIESFALPGNKDLKRGITRDFPRSFGDLIDVLLSQAVPIPEPHRPRSDLTSHLGDFYTLLSERLLAYITTLELWTDLSPIERKQVQSCITQLPDKALKRYDDAYAKLASDNHEFEVWTRINEAQALGTGLDRLQNSLEQMAISRSGRRTRQHLATSYKAALMEPITGTASIPEGVIVPTLDEAYVNPSCRVAEIGPADRPASAEWWALQETLPDTAAFLAGYLTSPRATKSPLVVLGEPGSGKSKMSEILAARLPEDDFLPILVQLRDVAAESTIQGQIEQAVLRGPGDRISWHDLID